MINENDTVFFDCGTTTPAIIDAIADELTFTAVCHSLNTFLALQDKPNCKVVLCGGEFKPNNYIFSSVSGRNELDHICPNIAFISAAGLSLQHGATCFNFDELEMKHRAMAMAQQRSWWQTTASSAKPNRPASAPDAVRSGDQRPPAGRRLHGVLQRQRHRYPLLIRLLRRRNRRRTAAIPFFPRLKMYK